MRDWVQARVFSSLHGYRSAWIAADVAAGLTLLAIAVPEQLATSRLAGMPPVTGLYAFVAGTVLIAMLGSNPCLSVGADSTIAPLFAVSVAHLAASGSPRYEALVGVLAVLVGAAVIAVGLLRLGWIADFLSAPIITGFMAGVAVIIVVHQLPDFLGIPAATGSTAHRVADLVRHLGEANGWTVGLGVGVLGVVLVAEAVDRRLPAALVGTIGSAALVAALGLQHHGVAVLGTFAHGVPHLGLRGLSWTALPRLASLAGVVALVVISQTAATTRGLADESGGEVDVNRDFMGVGAGSVVAAFVGAFPVNASPPRTAAVASAGGRTQATGLVAAAGVVLLVPAVGLLRDLPLTTLAAVLIFVAAKIFHGRELWAIARFGTFEFAVALITLLTVAIVGVEQGIGLAVALAVLDRARRSASPRLHLLGRIPGTTSWTPVSGPEQTEQVPGVFVVLFAAPLWYANAAHFRAEVHDTLGRVPGPLRLAVLDALGMSDIDYTGARALRSVLDDFERHHVEVRVARAGDRVRSGLSASGLLTRIGEDRLFPSVDEAVTGTRLPR